jgi:hypothetical protein
MRWTVACKVREAREKPADGNAAFEPREREADAGMGAGGKGEVAVG